MGTIWRPYIYVRVVLIPTYIVPGKHLATQTQKEVKNGKITAAVVVSIKNKSDLQRRPTLIHQLRPCL